MISELPDQRETDVSCLKTTKLASVTSILVLTLSGLFTEAQPRPSQGSEEHLQAGYSINCQFCGADDLAERF